MGYVDYGIGFGCDDARETLSGVSEKGIRDLGWILQNIGKQLKSQEGFTWNKWHRAKTLVVLDGMAYMAELGINYESPTKGFVIFDSLYEVPSSDPLRLKAEVSEKMRAYAEGSILLVDKKD